MDDIFDLLFEALQAAPEAQIDALYEALQRYKARYPRTIKRLPTIGRRLVVAIEEAYDYNH